MSIQTLRVNLAHATKIKSPDGTLIATVKEVEAALLDYGALAAEVSRLRQELGYIALAKKRSFENDREFRLWAQNRARHALGLKPGELTIRKERA